MKISTTLKMPRENAAFQLNLEKSLISHVIVNGKLDVPYIFNVIVKRKHQQVNIHKFTKLLVIYF